MKKWRSACIIDFAGNVLDYVVTDEVAAEWSVATRPRSEIIFSYIASEDDRLKLRQSMSDAMFSGGRYELQAKLTNGRTVNYTVSYIQQKNLWFLSSWVKDNDGSKCPLSARQVEIAQRLANDCTVQCCAKELGIADSSVQSHLYAARVKLGVESNLALTAIAVKNKWIKIE